MSKEGTNVENLEYRFYSLEEMSGIIGIPKEANQFARDTKRKLTALGYAFEWANRSGVRILSRTITPEMKLKKILVERLGLDTQVNPVDFAHYIIALTSIEGFASMPYHTKELVLQEIVGYNISEGTLLRWTAKLYATKNAHKCEYTALWHTYRDEYGMKRQEPADPDSEEYKEYSRLMSEQTQKNKDRDAGRQDQVRSKDTPYGRAIKQLYSTYGRYYWCPEIVLDALGDDMDEIISLVEEIIIPSE